jgi:hypothetical protein
MSVWFCIPSARPKGEAEPILGKWRGMGYRIALLRQGESVDADVLIPTKNYRGWAQSINILSRWVFAHDPLADWIVSGGDDTEPDPKFSAGHIASECTMHFGGTMGVMQPTGDRWANGSIDRICGSPWLGREWCRRSFGGNGPIWPEFMHMYGDEHLQNVAQKLGILWQRRDLTHLHKHYFRTSSDDVNHYAPIPEHMVEWNGSKHWAESRDLFNRLKAGGFKEAYDLLPA